LGFIGVKVSPETPFQEVPGHDILESRSASLGSTDFSQVDMLGLREKYINFRGFQDRRQAFEEVSGHHVLDLFPDERGHQDEYLVFLVWGVGLRVLGSGFRVRGLFVDQEDHHDEYLGWGVRG